MTSRSNISVSARRSRSFVVRAAFAASSSLLLLGAFGCQTPNCFTCGGKDASKELEIQRGKDPKETPIAPPLVPNTASLDSGAVEITPTDGSGDVSASVDSISPGKVEARQTAGVDWENVPPAAPSPNVSPENAAPSSESAAPSPNVSPENAAPSSESVAPANAAVSNAENGAPTSEKNEVTEESATEKKEPATDLPLKTNEYAASSDRGSAADVQASATSVVEESSSAAVSSVATPVVEECAPVADAVPSASSAAVKESAESNPSETPAVESGTSEENGAEEKNENEDDSDDDSFVGAPRAESFETAALERRVPASVPTFNDVRAIPRTVAFKTTVAAKPVGSEKVSVDVKPSVPRVFAPNVDPSTFGGKEIDASSRARSTSVAQPDVSASARTVGYESATVRTDGR